MKSNILVLAMLLGFAGFANATDVCTGNADGSREDVLVTPDMFIKEEFKMNCSKNVIVKYAEDGFMVGVCAVSKKGKNKWGASSEGGSVGNKGACAATDGCVDTDVTFDKAVGCL